MCITDPDFFSIPDPTTIEKGGKIPVLHLFCSHKFSQNWKLFDFSTGTEEVFAC